MSRRRCFSSSRGTTATPRRSRAASASRTSSLRRTLDGTPFQTIPIRGIPRWRETALWWPEERTLVTSEATGTVRYYRAPRRRLGVHPFLRLRPPHVLADFEPEHILCGHGDGLHANAAEALREALDHALRDVPAVAPRVLTARRHRFSAGS